MAKSNRRRGMPSILAFFLGLLFGIILILGGVGAAVLILLNYDLDKIEANKDSDGNYLYINANPDNGGVENALALISKVQEMAGKGTSLTIGDIEVVLPVAEKVTDAVFNALGEYVEVDRDEIKATAFSDLGAYMQELVMEMRVSALMSKAGVSGLEDSVIMSAILNGVEAKYTLDNGVYYPLYYDKYSYNGETGKYVRTADGAELSDDKAQFLEPFSDYYRLYYYDYSVTSDGVTYGHFVTFRDEEDSFVFTMASLSEEDIEKYYYEPASETYCTGNYYYDADGNKVEFNPVTVRYLADGGAQKTLDNMLVTDIVNDPDDLTHKIVGDITVGDLLGGAVNFSDILDKLTVADVMDIDPTSPIIAYLGYGITGISAGEEGVYYGNVTVTDGNGESRVVRCTVTTEDKDGKSVVSRVYYTEEGGNQEIEIASTRISEISDRIDRLTAELAISDIIDVTYPTADDNNAIMIFIAFSVTDVEAAEGQENLFKGLYHEEDANGNDVTYPCYLVGDGEKFVSAHFEDGTQISGTCIDGISAQINRLTKTLRLKDIMDIDAGNTLLNSLKDSTIDGLPDAVDNLTVNELYYDNIYSNQEVENKTDASRDRTILYMAVGKGTAQFKHVTEYNPLLIYYTLQDGEYSLATTTGKMAESDFNAEDENGNKNTYYSLGCSDTDGDGTPDEYYILFSEEFVYYTYDGSVYSLVGGDGDTQVRGHLSESGFAENTYYTYGSANALWKILLFVTPTEEVDDGAGGTVTVTYPAYERTYSVNSLTDMIANVSANTQYSTMRNLHEAGLMKFEDPTELDIVVSQDESGNSVTVGDLQLNELVSKFVTIIRLGQNG